MAVTTQDANSQMYQNCCPETPNKGGTFTFNISHSEIDLKDRAGHRNGTDPLIALNNR